MIKSQIDTDVAKIDGAQNETQIVEKVKESIATGKLDDATLTTEATLALVHPLDIDDGLYAAWKAYKIPKLIALARGESTPTPLVIENITLLDLGYKTVLFGTGQDNTHPILISKQTSTDGKPTIIIPDLDDTVKDAQLHWQDGKWWISNQNDANPGQRNSAEIVNGSSVTIGSVRLQVAIDAANTIILTRLTAGPVRPPAGTPVFGDLLKSLNDQTKEAAAENALTTILQKVEATHVTGNTEPNVRRLEARLSVAINDALKKDFFDTGGRFILPADAIQQIVNRAIDQMLKKPPSSSGSSTIPGQPPIPSSGTTLPTPVVITSREEAIVAILEVVRKAVPDASEAQVNAFLLQADEGAKAYEGEPVNQYYVFKDLAATNFPTRRS